MTRNFDSVAKSSVTLSERYSLRGVWWYGMVRKIFCLNARLSHAYSVLASVHQSSFDHSQTEESILYEYIVYVYCMYLASLSLSLKIVYVFVFMISIFYHNLSFSFFCIVFLEGVTDATRRFTPVYGNTDPCNGYSQYLLPLFSLRRFKRTRVLDYLAEESRQMVSLFLRASRSSCDLRSVAFICLR